MYKKQLRVNPLDNHFLVLVAFLCKILCLKLIQIFLVNIQPSNQPNSVITVLIFANTLLWKLSASQVKNVTFVYKLGQAVVRTDNDGDGGSIIYR